MKLLLILLFAWQASAQETLSVSIIGLNLGTVIYNSKYKIYRSKILGEKGLKKLSAEFKTKGLEFPKTIIYLHYKDFKGRNPRAFQEYNLRTHYSYDFLHPFNYSYRTYLDGRNPSQPEKDIDKSSPLSELGLTIFGVPIEDGLDGGIDALARILDVVLDPDRQPVLLRCHRHRLLPMVDESLDVFRFEGPFVRQSEIQRPVQLPCRQHEDLASVVLGGISAITVTSGQL